VKKRLHFCSVFIFENFIFQTLAMARFRVHAAFQLRRPNSGLVVESLESVRIRFWLPTFQSLSIGLHFRVNVAGDAGFDVREAERRRALTR